MEENAKMHHFNCTFKNKSQNFHGKEKIHFSLKIIVNFEGIKYPQRNFFRFNYSVSESL